MSGSAPATDEIDAKLRDGRAAWPQLVVEPAVFASWVSARLAEEELRAADSARVADLYLACACSHAVPGAAEAFARAHVPALTRSLRDVDAQGVDVDDLVQRVLERVLVAEPGAQPRITEYRGRGSLAGWLRVVGARVRLNARRNQSDRADPLPDRLDALLTDELDPELAYLKAHCRAVFRESLAAALASLSERERSLLRLQVVHGLGATAIAEIFQVHRATTKRWLAQARVDVLERTRSELTRRLGVRDDEVDSVLRLIASRLEASVHRWLAQTQDRSEDHFQPQRDAEDDVADAD